MGSRDRPHREAKKKPKSKLAQPKLSALSEPPPQQAELIRKPRKPNPVQEETDGGSCPAPGPWDGLSEWQLWRQERDEMAMTGQRPAEERNGERNGGGHPAHPPPPARARAHTGDTPP